MKPKFSIQSLLLATTVVAFAIVAATSLSSVWTHQREFTVLRQQIRQLETAAAIKQLRIKNEFLAVYPDPFVLIDPRVPKANPWILRVGNSRYTGAGGNYWVGARDRKKRLLNIELRLLRSIDKTDYYRLVYAIDGKAEPDLLFEYVGKPKLVVATDSTTITICPDRESCIGEAVRRYDASESEKLRDAWTNGPYKPITRTANFTRPRPVSK